MSSRFDLQIHYSGVPFFGGCLAGDALATLNGTFFRGLALGAASLATEDFVVIEAESSSAALGSTEFNTGPPAIADALADDTA